jgi:impB/mucB/samB family C-terminal domain
VGGVGKVLEKILFAFGLKNMGDVREQLAVMIYAFPPATAEFLLYSTLGISQEEGKCEHNHNSKNEISKNGNFGECSEDVGRKSLGAERTFSLCCDSPEEQKNKLKELCYKVGEKLKEKNIWGKTVTLKVKTVKFELFTRSVTNKSYFQSGEIIEKLSFQLLESLFPLKIRLIGVTITKFKNEQNTTSSTSSPLRSLSNYFKSAKSPKNVLIDSSSVEKRDEREDDDDEGGSNIDRNGNNDDDNRDTGNSRRDDNIEVYDDGHHTDGNNNESDIRNNDNSNNNRNQNITTVRARSMYGHVDLFDPNDRLHGDEEPDENSDIETGDTDFTEIPIIDDDDNERDKNDTHYNDNDDYSNSDSNYYNDDDVHRIDNHNSSINISNNKSSNSSIDISDGTSTTERSNSNKKINSNSSKASSMDASRGCVVLPPASGSHISSIGATALHREMRNTTTTTTHPSSSSLSSCPALTQKLHHPCPVCGRVVPGTLYALNMHIDQCLLVGSGISRCTQYHRNSSFTVNDNSPGSHINNVNKGGRDVDTDCTSSSASVYDHQSARHASKHTRNPAGNNNSKKNKKLTDSSQFSKTKKLRNNNGFDGNIGQENGNKITNFLFHTGRK